ncbi:hypothetical protein M1141_01460 [Candidatus Marsarchaeota archaeon]|nr:hypothetical protein [Candidatus Marsarchaeota archaeon]
MEEKIKNNADKAKTEAKKIIAVLLRKKEEFIEADFEGVKRLTDPDYNFTN